jgi:hypothetical protein
MTSVMVDGTTITGDGVTTALSAAGGSGFTGVVHDTSLTGTGVDSDNKLGLAMAQSLNS